MKIPSRWRHALLAGAATLLVAGCSAAEDRTIVGAIDTSSVTTIDSATSTSGSDVATTVVGTTSVDTTSIDATSTTGDPATPSPTTAIQGTTPGTTAPRGPTTTAARATTTTAAGTPGTVAPTSTAPPGTDPPWTPYYGTPSLSVSVGSCDPAKTQRLLGITFLPTYAVSGGWSLHFEWSMKTISGNTEPDASGAYDLTPGIVQFVSGYHATGVYDVKITAQLTGSRPVAPLTLNATVTSPPCV